MLKFVYKRARSCPQQIFNARIPSKTPPIPSAPSPTILNPPTLTSPIHSSPSGSQHSQPNHQPFEPTSTRQDPFRSSTPSARSQSSPFRRNPRTCGSGTGSAAAFQRDKSSARPSTDKRAGFRLLRRQGRSRRRGLRGNVCTWLTGWLLSRDISYIYIYSRYLMD